MEKFFQAIQNMFKIPELRTRILFTLGLLAIYRLGSKIQSPGINAERLQQVWGEVAGTLLGVLDLFSGGNFQKISVLALGVTPYITASIIMQLMPVLSPAMKKIQEEGEVGRQKMNQWTRYMTVVLCAIQTFFVATWLSRNGVIADTWWATAMIVVTLTTGTIFVMWLGEQITERGVGNGISLLIFAGIVARLPSAITTTFQFIREGELNVLVALFMLVLIVAVVGAIIFVERGQRRIPVQYAKRVVGRKMYGGQSSHLPLKVNTANVIPVIFASSILIFPATMAQFAQYPWVQTAATYLSPGQWLHDLVFALLIIFFAFFYTAVVFNPTDVAENMKKFGGYIPGIRPGQKTADYIERVLSRITLSGAIYLCIVALLPTILVSQFNVPFYFGGTALLIVVGVALDTVAQMESHLITRNYEGFMKRGRLRGRRG